MGRGDTYSNAPITNTVSLNGTALSNDSLADASFISAWNLVPELGRVKLFDTGKFGNKETDRWGFNQSSTLSFSGRHVLPIWRILKADNKFSQNSFEHIVYHTLHLR